MNACMISQTFLKMQLLAFFFATKLRYESKRQSSKPDASAYASAAKRHCGSVRLTKQMRTAKCIRIFWYTSAHESNTFSVYADRRNCGLDCVSYTARNSR